MRNLLFSISLLLFLAACGDSGEQKDTDGNPEKESPSTAVNGTPDKVAAPDFIAAVNGLRLREKPAQDAKVVGKVDEGAVLKNLNEKTDFKTKITLRGVEHNKPWYKVETPDGTKGWVFGGAIHEKGEASAFDLASFENYLTRLDKNDCGHVNVAIKELTKRLTESGSAKTKISDQAIDQFSMFLNSVTGAAEMVLEGMSENDKELLVYNPDDKPLPKDLKTKIAEWDKCWLIVVQEEGYPYITMKPGVLADNFKDLASSAMKDYLEQQKKELEEGYSHDAGLVINAQQLAERVAFWERFVQKHNGFLYENNVKALLRNYLGTLMSGMDNTPSADFQTLALLPEFESAFKWFLKENKGTESAKTISDYYNILKANNMKRGPKAVKFMADYWSKKG